jgi:hypothetical protein
MSHVRSHFAREIGGGATPENFALFANFFEQEKTEGTENYFELSTPSFPLLPPVQMMFFVPALPRCAPALVFLL